MISNIAKISKTLRGWTATALIFMGLGVVMIGSAIVHAGAWVNTQNGDDDADYYGEYPDLTDEELRQVIKEAKEARRDDS